ncbi:hypothetical protein ACXEO8_07140 [Cytobacillus firmus]
MGVEKNLSVEKFPKQGEYLHKRTQVCFGFDNENLIGGTIVRDDREEPYLTIIRLDDGKYIRSTECQYSIPK